MIFEQFYRRARTKLTTPKSLGFTLVELMVSVVVLSILMLVMAQLLGKTQTVWSSASAKVSQFREARRAFDRIVRNLSQATLNPYIQYVYSGADPRVPPATTVLSAPPLGYARYSELNFISGVASSLLAGAGGVQGHAVFFQAPLGTTDLPMVSAPTLLNPIGYFVQSSTDSTYRPDFLDGSSIPIKNRFRLYEYRAPAENNRVYNSVERDQQASFGVASPTWFNDFGVAGRSHPVADNIVFMVIAPRLPQSTGTVDPYSIAKNFSYNSWGQPLSAGQGVQNYQLPPIVDVYLVAVDEPSVSRYETLYGKGTLESKLSFSGQFSVASESGIRDDLAKVESILSDLKLNYRIFNASVQLRNSRW